MAAEKSDLNIYRFYLETDTPVVLGGALLVDEHVYTDMHTRFEDAQKPPDDEFNWSPTPEGNV